MSFVLEALKRQEAGDDPAAAVSLAKSAHHRRRQRLWIGLFTVAMVANAALLLWIFALPDSSSQARRDTAAAPTPQTTPDAEAAAPQRQPNAAAAVQHEPVGATAPSGSDAGRARSATSPDARQPSAGDAGAAAPAPASAAPATASARPRSEPGPRRVALGDLPPAARARFPGIAFSTHIYAEDVDLRAVVANGQRLVEGDRIRGLRVAEITETGVVLGFESYEVEVPIVTDWDAL